MMKKGSITSCGNCCCCHSTHKTVRINCFLLILLTLILECCNAANANEERGTDGKTLPKAATFHFPEYAYKETSKNEIIFHELEVTCGQHANCANVENGIMKTACIRRCISRGCYEDIYAFDEWEEGEIDVRLNSFKGCVIQRENTKHM